MCGTISDKGHGIAMCIYGVSDLVKYKYKCATHYMIRCRASNSGPSANPHIETRVMFYLKEIISRQGTQDMISLTAGKSPHYAKLKSENNSD